MLMKLPDESKLFSPSFNIKAVLILNTFKNDSEIVNIRAINFFSYACIFINDNYQKLRLFCKFEISGRTARETSHFENVLFTWMSINMELLFIFKERICQCYLNLSNIGRYIVSHKTLLLRNYLKCKKSNFFHWKFYW